MVKEEKKNILLLIVLLIIALIITIFVFSSRSNKNSVNITDKISMVTDNSRFFTVTSCVSKYLTYLSSRDTTNLLLLLDKKYIDSNHISESNIFSFVDSVGDNSEFTATRMYQERVNDNVMKYYVSGFIRPMTYFEDMEDSYKVQAIPFYVIVNMDLKQKIFSIIPYDGKIFLKGGTS